MSNLILWTCNDHATIWPVGGASIVIAENEEEARILLDKALDKAGIHETNGSYTLVEVSMDEPIAIVLCNGDY